VNGSPTKTQMVDSAGGRSQLSQLACAAVVLVVLLFLTGPLAYLPAAVLASIVFLIGVELVDVRGMRRVLYARPREFWVALLTAAVVVAAGVEQAIVVAMALSLISHTRRGYSPRNAVEAPTPQGFWRSLPVPVRWLCVDGAAIDDVDFTGGVTLAQVADTLRRRGVRLVFASVSDHVREELDRSGVTALVGAGAYFIDLEQVWEEYRNDAAREGPDRDGAAGDAGARG
jgi:sulfate permease, SulP family